jgi:hypothetical protein
MGHLESSRYYTRGYKVPELQGFKDSRVQGFPDGGIFVSLRQVKGKKTFKERNPAFVCRDLDSSSPLLAARDEFK